MKSWGSSDSSPWVMAPARWWIRSGVTNSSRSPPISSAAPFKPLAMMPISKTPVQPVLRFEHATHRARRGYVGSLGHRRCGLFEGGIDVLGVAARTGPGRCFSSVGGSRWWRARRAGRGCGARDTSGGAGPGSVPPPPARRGCTCRSALPSPARLGTCRSRRGTPPTPASRASTYSCSSRSASRYGITGGGQDQQGPGGSLDQTSQAVQQRTHRRQVRQRPGRLPQWNRARPAQLPPQRHPVPRRLSRQPGQQHQPAPAGRFITDHRSRLHS